MEMEMESVKILSDVSSPPAGPEAGGRVSSGGKRRAQQLSQSRALSSWPPAWATPPWPLWSDVEVAKEPWDVGKVPKPPDPYALPVFEESIAEAKKSKSTKSIKSTPLKKEKNKKKLASEAEEDMLYIPFDDPLGPGALPASLAPLVVQWVRGADVPNVQLLSPTEEANFGRGVREPPDLGCAVQHALCLSPLLRFIVANIRSLYLMGRDDPLPLEATDEYIPEVKAPWRPWHCIYSLCEASSTQPPTPQLNPAGKYVVRLFFLGNWRRVTVDDRIPEDALGRPLLPVLLPGSDSRASTATSAASGAKGDGLRIWPAILCKALLRVASLSFREGVDDEECGEVACFSPIACLTGWVMQRLDIRGLEPTITWALLQKLLNANSTEPEQRFYGYVSPKEEVDAKRKAEALLIPAKYDFPKKPRPPPPPVEISEKDKDLWEPVDTTSTEAEILYPAAVLAILREDLRTSPANETPSTPSSSFDWSWLGSDHPPSTASGEEGDREASTSDRATSDDQWSDRGPATTPAKSTDVIEHNALCPRWEQPVLLRGARIVSIDEDRDRPPTPLWQRHRWKAWAIAHGLIPPQRMRTEHHIRVFTPLLGLVQIPPLPLPLGPLHPPIPPPPLPLGYPFRYFPTGKKNEDQEKPKEDDMDKGKEKENQKGGKPSVPANEGQNQGKHRKESSEPQKGTKAEKNKKSVKLTRESRISTAEKYDEVNNSEQDEASEKDTLESWVRFETLHPEVLALQVFYRPSTFTFKAQFTSLVPAKVQTQALTMGVDSLTSASKRQALVKGKDLPKPVPEIYSNKLPMPPSEFGTEPLFFFIDSIYCKKVLFQLNIVSDDVLKDVNSILDVNNPEKLTLDDTLPTPYEHNVLTKNVNSGHLVAEEYYWAESSMGKRLFTMKTNGSQSLLVNIDGGMTIYRLWVKAPRNFSLLILSESEFSVGGRLPVHILMTKESASYIKCGNDLSLAYNELLETENKAPILHQPPSPEDAQYKRGCLLGQEKGAHAIALKNFYGAVLPPATPHLTLDKLDRISLKLINRLELALLSLLMEKLLPVEECVQCISQWQRVLQEPFFGLMTLKNYEEFGKPTNDVNQWQMIMSKEGDPAPGVEDRTKRLSAQAADILREMGFAEPLVVMGHPGADECEVTEGVTPVTPATTPTTPPAVDARAKSPKGKERKTKVVTVNEATVVLDPETGIEVLKRMLLPRPDLLHLYPFRTDHLHKMYFTEYRGVTKMTTREWTPLMRCVINPHQDHPVLCAVFAWANNLPYPWVMVIDNETLQPVATPTRFGSVGPFYAKHCELGYTVLILSEIPLSMKEVSWVVRLTATKPDDVIHYCRPPPEAPPPPPPRSPADGSAASGQQDSTSAGSDGASRVESAARRLVKDASGKKTRSAAAPAVCPGPQQPPQLLVLEIRGLYTAASDGIIACGLLKIPVFTPWCPTLLLSLHVRLSSPKAKFHFTMENVDTGAILIETTSTGHKTIPVMFLDVPPPSLDAPKPKRKITTTGLSEVMLMAALAGVKVGSVFRGPSFYGAEESAADYCLTLRLTVRVKPGDWPMTPTELNNVTLAKQEEMRKGMLYVDQQENVVDKYLSASYVPRRSTSSASSAPISLTPSTSTLMKTIKRISRSISSVGSRRVTPVGSDCPNYLLVAVLDSDKVPRAELVSDIPREVTMRLIKEEWEKDHPGRHLIAEEARNLFLSRREEGKKILNLRALAEEQIYIFGKGTGSVPMISVTDWDLVGDKMMTPPRTPPVTPIMVPAPASAGADPLDWESSISKPILRTQKEMVDEMTQNAYDRNLISSPFNPVYVTLEDVQERTEALCQVIEQENRVGEYLSDRLEKLRSTQERIAQLTSSSVNSSEAHAQEVYSGTQEVREKTIGDARKAKKMKESVTASGVPSAFMSVLRRKSVKP